MTEHEKFGWRMWAFGTAFGTGSLSRHPFETNSWLVAVLFGAANGVCVYLCILAASALQEWVHRRLEAWRS